ncbi:MAG: PEGA domain-containing protein [Candidatus Korobacteraceae bacterium]
MKLEISGVHVANTPRILIFLLAAIAAARGGGPAAAPACSKNVSFAIAEGGQPVPAIPKFAVKWVDRMSHQQDSKGLCFSQIPSSTANNYLVIFSSSEATFEGLTPSAHTYTSTKGGPGDTSMVSSYGGTWSYSYVGMPPPSTTTTLDLKRDDKPKSLFVRAYNQQGRVISKYSLGGFFSREKVLEYVFTSIMGDAAPVQKQKSVAVPLSVYYVNCDVDSPPVETAAAESPSPSAPPVSAPKEVPRDAPMPKAVPKAVLDIWSQPAGADIALDGAYVGKTPYSLTVPPGEHSIALHKQDFGSWQRRMQVDSGTHQVGAYLEQKTLSLDFPAAPPGAHGSTASASDAREESPAQAVLEFWSIPTGADITMDGQLVGTTPYSLVVSPGEHTVILSKKDVGTWQGKIRSSPGKHRVGANLQRKSATLQ